MDGNKRQKMGVQLWSYWRSSCSWRVRIALELKEVAYEVVAVNLLKKEQTNADFETNVNHMQQVPVLSIDGVILTQSVAICEYLDETRKESPLFPADPKMRAIVRRLVEIINSGIQPLQNMGVLNKIEEMGGDKMEWGKSVIERGFQALENELNHNVPGRRAQSRFCLGDVISLADVFLVPQVYNAIRFKVDMTQFPTISKINENLSTHPAFIAAHPDNQIDACTDA